MTVPDRSRPPLWVWATVAIAVAALAALYLTTRPTTPEPLPITQVAAPATTTTLAATTTSSRPVAADLATTTTTQPPTTTTQAPTTTVAVVQPTTTSTTEPPPPTTTTTEATTTTVPEHTHGDLVDPGTVCHRHDGLAEHCHTIEAPPTTLPPVDTTGDCPGNYHQWYKVRDDCVLDEVRKEMLAFQAGSHSQRKAAIRDGHLLGSIFAESQTAAEGYFGVDEANDLSEITSLWADADNQSRWGIEIYGAQWVQPDLIHVRLRPVPARRQLHGRQLERGALHPHRRRMEDQLPGFLQADSKVHRIRSVGGGNPVALPARPPARPCQVGGSRGVLRSDGRPHSPATAPHSRLVKGRTLGAPHPDLPQVLGGGCGRRRADRPDAAVRARPQHGSAWRAHRHGVGVRVAVGDGRVRVAPSQLVPHLPLPVTQPLRPWAAVRGVGGDRRGAGGPMLHGTPLVVHEAVGGDVRPPPILDRRERDQTRLATAPHRTDRPRIAVTCPGQGCSRLADQGSLDRRGGSRPCTSPRTRNRASTRPATDTAAGGHRGARTITQRPRPRRPRPQRLQIRRIRCGRGRVRSTTRSASRIRRRCRPTRIRT